MHGSLTALLLLDAARRCAPTQPLASVTYRAIRPLFCGNPITLCTAPTADRRGLEVWAEDHDGFVAMRGAATFA